mgnify:CR=1 FL=1
MEAEASTATSAGSYTGLRTVLPSRLSSLDGPPGDFASIDVSFGAVHAVCDLGSRGLGSQRPATRERLLFIRLRGQLDQVTQATRASDQLVDTTTRSDPGGHDRVVTRTRELGLVLAGPLGRCHDRRNRRPLARINPDHTNG